MSELIRLSKYIASAGVASRRGADRLIEQGMVTVNQQVVREAYFRVDPNSDVVEVDGKKCELETQKEYYLLNKPRGYTCSNSDPYAQKLAVSLIESSSRLFSIGRLDKQSEGAIIFTNDGDFANKLGHPKRGVVKIYQVYIEQQIVSRPQILRILKDGVMDDGELLKPVKLKVIAEKESGSVLEFHLVEGKNREIRRICENSEWSIKRLIRVAIGNLKLGKLPTGKSIVIDPQDVF